MYYLIFNIKSNKSIRSIKCIDLLKISSIEYTIIKSQYIPIPII